MNFQELCQKYDIQLSPQQEKAALRKEGETLLLAVPGSGKTTVIVARTGYLMLCCNIPASKILTITYSKAAALEMTERFANKFSDISETPKFSTIHSLCVSILHYAHKTQGVEIPKLNTENKRIIRSVLYDKTKVWISDFLVKQLALLLTLVKNKMYSKEQIEAMRCFDLHRECPKYDFGTFYAAYEDYKKKHNIMDFDDQLTMAYDILLDYDDVRWHFQKAYPYIGVDESQDTSLIQYQIIGILANGGKSLFVVGDDDQSIYGFRGAEPSNILNFTSFFPSAEVLYMENNYRSCKEVVEAADRFIAVNKSRYEKTAVAVRDVKGKIDITGIESERGLISAVVRQIKEFANADKTLAVIARNNYALLSIVHCLDEQNITVRRRDNFESFFNFPAVLSIINIVRLAFEPWNLSAFNGCKSAMRLYIRREASAKINKKAEAKKDSTDFRVMDIAKQVCGSIPMTKKAIDKAEKALKLIALQAPELAVRTAISRFQQSVDEYFDGSDDSINISSIYMGILCEFAEHYKTIPDFLQAVQKYTYSKNDTRGIDSNITLTTIHSAKGLEFDKVIIIDAIEGIMPSKGMGSDIIDEEEDARMFYVAITRAKQEIEFIVPRTLYGNSVRPSQFINRLNTTPDNTRKRSAKPTNKTENTAFSVGDKVFHATFGNGTVKAVSKNVLTIAFEKAGEKRILDNFCKKA